MINWYKPSEKMPEVGDVVIVLTRPNMELKTHRIEIYKWSKWYSFDSDQHWAYASEFSFPKEKK